MTVSWRTTSRSATRRVGLIGSLAVTLGIGAAIAGNAGFAHADGPPDGATASTNEPADAARPSDAPDTDQESVADSAESVSRLSERGPEHLSASPAEDRTPATGGLVEQRSATHALDAPRHPTRARIEPEPVEPPRADPAVPVPSPEDQMPTEYGDIGKWMLTAGDQIANWGGKRHDGKTLLEPVNVIIVDPKSASASQAAGRLNHAMFWSGFPAQPLHSIGFSGSIDNVMYGQQPQGPLQSYSNNFFLLRNDHGRIFGPDPVETASGFVWSGAFSTEEVGFSGSELGHVYVSSDRARDALARRLVATGQATYAGMIPLENAYNTDTDTTGDHDGFAVVLILTGTTAVPRREFVTDGSSGLRSADIPEELTCSAVSAAAETLGQPRHATEPGSACGVPRRSPELDTLVVLSYL